MIRILNSLVVIFFLFCFGCSNIHKAVLSGEIDKVLAFVQDEEDVNAKDEQGMTPLMYAVTSNNIRVMEILLANGADVNIKNNHDKTAQQQAYDLNYFDAFKVLLENGAESDFIRSKNVRDSGSKREYYKLSKEYLLYSKLLNIHTGKAVKLFDMYFSIYSNGYYMKEVVKLFSRFIQDDFENIYTNPLDKQKVKNFINTYSEMGKNYYLVAAGSLNIRQGASPETESVGDYSRGDKVYAAEEQEDWLRTNRGWINRNYTKQILKEIPFVRQYIKKASGLMERKPEKTKTAFSSPVNKHKRPAFPIKKKINYNKGLKKKAEKQQPEHKNNNSTDIQKELDSVLTQASMESLEAFIQKYKNKTEYASFVKIARAKYKSILLGNEK